MGYKKSNHIMIQNKLMKSPILKLKPKSDTIAQIRYNLNFL